VKDGHQSVTTRWASHVQSQHGPPPLLLTSRAGVLAPLGTATLLALTSLLAGCVPATRPDPAASGWILWSIRFSGS